MKTFSKTQLQEAAKPVFKKYGTDELFATEDGKLFLEENKAINHSLKVKQKVIKLEGQGKETAKDPITPKSQRQNEKDTIELVKEAESLDTLSALEGVENADDDGRKSVLSVIETKKEELEFVLSNED